MKAKTYISDVVEGKAKPDAAVGRALSQALQDNSLFLEDKKVQELVESATKDTLMVGGGGGFCGFFSGRRKVICGSAGCGALSVV